MTRQSRYMQRFLSDLADTRGARLTGERYRKLRALNAARAVRS